jgi:uncharacterized membrane protein
MIGRTRPDRMNASNFSAAKRRVPRRRWGRCGNVDNMETRTRTLLKAVTWQVLGLATTGALAWFHTGSAIAALSFALSTAGAGLAFFIVHERIWARVRWGLGPHGT